MAAPERFDLATLHHAKYQMVHGATEKERKAAVKQFKRVRSMRKRMAEERDRRKLLKEKKLERAAAKKFAVQQAAQAEREARNPRIHSALYRKVHGLAPLLKKPVDDITEEELFNPPEGSEEEEVEEDEDSWDYSPKRKRRRADDDNERVNPRTDWDYSDYDEDDVLPFES